MDPFGDPFAEKDGGPASPAPKGKGGGGKPGAAAPKPVSPAFKTAETENFAREDFDRAKGMHGLKGGGSKSSSLKHFGETDALAQPLENLGDTGAVRPLENFGDTGATDDPFQPSETMDEAGAVLQESEEADVAQAIPDEADVEDTRDESGREVIEGPSRGALRPGDTEENVFLLLPDQPEPDSQPAFLNKGSQRGKKIDRSAITDDMPRELSDLEALRTPSFVKGGSEGMPLGGGEAHRRSGLDKPMVDDLRDIGKPPALGEDTKDETGPGMGDEETAAVADHREEEPDFLYGERFHEKYRIPEGPVRKPSKGPQVAAAVGGLLLVGIIVAAILKYGGGTREFTPPAPPPVAATGPSIISVPSPRPIPLPRPTGGTSGVERPNPDDPPPLPPPQDGIAAKVRRGLAWGLPIEKPKAKAPAAGTGTGTDTGTGTGGER